jgi:hypothetical protein
MLQIEGNKKDWKEKILNFLTSLRCPLSINEYWSVLFIACLSLFMPKLWIGLFAFFFYKTHREKMVLRPALVDLPNLVLHIQMNHLTSLTSYVERNPEILYYQYKNLSLLSWCIYYKNQAAHSAISDLMKKHPRPTAPTSMAA